MLVYLTHKHISYITETGDSGYDYMSTFMHLVLRVCGEQPDGTVTETSKTNKMEVVFYSDSSYVDRGFEAEYEAIDMKDRK